MWFFLWGHTLQRPIFGFKSPKKRREPAQSATAMYVRSTIDEPLKKTKSQPSEAGVILGGAVTE